MKTTATSNFFSAVLVCALAVSANAADPKIEKKQLEIRNMAHDTLKTLYKADPRTKAAIKSAAGYAVFSNFGVKILVAGSGTGKGIAVDNKTKHETFMKMIELQAGLGMGVKKFRIVFVFDNQKAFEGFVNSGWEFGGQTTAAAKNGTRAQPWRERCQCRTACGCISSPTRDAGPPRLPLRAPSTTKTMI